MRQPLVPYRVVVGAPINLNGNTQFSSQFPMGPGYYEMAIRLSIAVVIGTGAGPITEGILNFLRQIHLKTDRGEVPVDNLSARALHKIAWIKRKTKPRYDEIAAASATYRIDIPILFADYEMMRPEDTILNTSRYNSITLDLTTGPLTDLFTAPGTAAVTITADIVVLGSRGRWSSAPEAQPVGYVSYSKRPVVDANGTTSIDFERASDLSVKRAYLHTSANGTTGMHFYGTNADDVIEKLNLQDSEQYWVKDAQWDMHQDDNKRQFALEAVPAGLLVLDFVRDRSNKAALFTGDKTMLQLNWTNKAGVAANDHVSLVVEGLRAFKEAA